MEFKTVEIRDQEGTDTNHYDMEVAQNFTVEGFMDAVITDPANRAARGEFKIIEAENRTKDRLYDCKKEAVHAMYQMAELYEGFPMPKQYLKRNIQKIEASGYGLGAYNPVIGYLLLLKKEVSYFENENGQLSFFPVEKIKKKGKKA